MSAYEDAFAIDADVSDERLAEAAKILTSGKGIVMLAKLVALRAEHSYLLCEVVDPMPSARRCANEYEVLIENAQRALDTSGLRTLLPDLPREWLVVEDDGIGTVELWRAP